MSLTPKLLLRLHPYDTIKQIATPNTSPKMAPTLTEQDFNFFYGDFEILVTLDGREVTGQVSSKAMAAASPVWNKFIHPPWGRDLPEFKHSLPCDDTIKYLEMDNAKDPLNNISFDCFNVPPKPMLEIRSDDPEALSVLLNIVHSQRDRVNRILHERLFYHVAVLCEQYMCLKIVKPWVHRWIQDPDAYMNGHPWQSSNEDWLFVYYVFGQETELERVATTVVQYIGKEVSSATQNDTELAGEDESRFGGGQLLALIRKRSEVHELKGKCHRNC